MRMLRVFCVLLLTSFCSLAFTAKAIAQQTTDFVGGAPSSWSTNQPESSTAAPAGYAFSDSKRTQSDAKSGRAGGVKEIVPGKYRERYQNWKAEFLATEIGRTQWRSYEQNPEFSLTIIVTEEERHGAGTGKYTWNDTGKLIGATIRLGNRLNEGYPNPIYYPVMNALGPRESSSLVIKDNVLAAAKIAHEFGHLKQVANMDGAAYRLQNELIPVYNKILLSNGRNTNDPRLLSLEKQMGGTPVEIWENREYWGEANAMLYLRDRITNENEQRALFNRIRHSVELYAKEYAERFEGIGGQ
jgi:hypothetical protein